MNKKLIRLTESDLHRIVKESVNRVLNEVTIGALWNCRDKNINDVEDEEVLNHYKEQIEIVRKLYPIWCKKNGLRDDTEKIISMIESDNGPFYRSGCTVVEYYLPFGFRDFCLHHYRIHI